jgi:hypothetical protein
MVGLLDIAPSFKTVSVNGADVNVTGISAKGVAYMLGRFPEFRAIFLGGGMKSENIMETGPQMVAAMIAAGTGSPGDVDAERIADGLNLEAQFDLIEAIIDATMPKGAGPFVKRLTGLLNSVAAAQHSPPDQAGVTSPSTGTEKPTTSQPPSASLSEKGTPPETSGS